jgi:NAD(P)H-quinone oxidoreductase subunit 5
MLMNNGRGLFYVDMLSIIMISLVSFLGVVIYFFSKRYMKGDSLYSKFFQNKLALLTSVICMACADNLLLFLMAWSCCNWVLVKLIVHKHTWQAAKASGRLAAKNFIIGFVFISLAFACMYKETGSVSIQYIVHHLTDSIYSLSALIMLILAAMTQSAIWPFHRWLISSLNAPTNVSAMMHAGIVNGGGFLLARFSPLYLGDSRILTVIFIIGIITALLGSIWKLMQHDIKRMLACSTVGQMGFMFAQCGLGLFPAAVAHLCWHGMFKSYLFLSSGGAAQEKRFDLSFKPSLTLFLLSFVCGLIGSYIFALMNKNHMIFTDATLVTMGVFFLASCQLALTVMRENPLKRLPLAILFTVMMSIFYGSNVYFFDFILSPLNLMRPQPLNVFHVSALILLVIAWGSMFFLKHLKSTTELPGWLLKFYVKMLNSSQPQAATVTAHRKGYDYV